MKITRLKKRSISVFVIIALLLSCLPLSIFASDDIPEIEVPLEPEIKITELVDRREESVKHFKMPDGTYNAISYAGAVHRMNLDGEWIDINNDLSLKTVGSKQLYTTNDSRITFAKAYSSNEDIMTLRENGYAISMALLSNQNDDDDMSMDMNANASLVTVNNSNYSRPESFDTIDEAIEINNKSSISYSNVLADTDIEYVMNGNDIKENIIVKDRADSYVYAFSLSLDGLVPLLDESGAIYLNDEESGDTKYVIPAPYMYDSNDEYSEEVYYELLHVGGDKYLLTVTASSEWINDEERAFPVTVDPSVVTTTSGMHDAYISSVGTNSSFGMSYKLTIKSSQIVLINMPLPSIHTSTSGGIFEYAYLYVKYYGENTYGTTGIGSYKILKSWNESTVTYSNMNMNATSNKGVGDVRYGTATFVTDSSLNSYNTMTGSIEVTGAVEDYYSKGASFYGVALKYNSGNGNVVIKSHESSSADAAYIKITYIVIDSGDYLLQNRGTQSFAQLTNDATNYNNSGITIEVNELVSGDNDNSNGNNDIDTSHQKWLITHVGNGFFSIISSNSGKALSIRSNELNKTNASIIQEEYVNESRQQWKISRTLNGTYTIRPKSANQYNTDWCMGVSNIDNKLKVVQQEFLNDNNLHDEWVLAKIGLVHNNIEFEGQKTPNWCWAATARMFVSNYQNVSSQKTQVAAVEYLYYEVYEYFNCSIVEQKGDTFDTQILISYYQDRENTLDYVEDTFNTTVSNALYNKATLTGILHDGGVIYVARGNYVFDEEKQELVYSGHAMLIYGYVTINSEICFLIRDPAPRRTLTTNDIDEDGYIINPSSHSVIMSYDKICNGYNAKSWENVDTYTFSSAIVLTEHLTP